jgi:hypothetical protein
MLHAGLVVGCCTFSISFRLQVKGWGLPQGAVLSHRTVTWTESSNIVLLIKYTLKPANNETARDQNFTVAGRFPLIQVL